MCQIKFRPVLHQSSVPLYIQIKEVIREAIVSGNLRSGQLVPSERQMCRIFDVSHISVRQALVELTREGYLFRVPGKGTYVAESLSGWETKGQPIGVVIPSTNGGLTSPFISDFLVGLKKVATKAGLDVLLYTDVEETYFHPRKIGQLQGIILTEPHFSDKRITKLRKTGLPMVVVGRTEEEGVYTVDADHRRIFQMLTEYLLKLGHRQIGFINGPAVLTVSADKLQGYQQALKKYRVSFDQKLVRYGPFSEESGYQNAKKLLGYPITALVCGDDFISVGALRAIREKKLRVPEDISLCGCHNSSFTQHTIPSLTTADIFASLLGEKAGEKLLRRLNNEEVETRTVIQGKLIIRESTQEVKKK
ncbi:MAG: GntR family transcriptional regulator [Candidatus Omnitrophica bacterium]|nr:GntR family transcriptional regulator [Candidatus Omnitrophota bacterium]